MSSRGKTTARNVIDLLDSSEEERDNPAASAKKKRAPVPKLDAVSPPSTSTANSSRNALASLLAGNGKPPLPPRRGIARSSKTAAGTTKPAAKRRLAAATAAGTETINGAASGSGAGGGGGVGNALVPRQSTSQQPSETTQDLWTIKHDPMCLEDLVVHKKKVEEVRAWLQRHRATDDSGAPLLHGGKMLVITGPPGCGKSTTLHVLAEALEFQTVEWQAQAQISWEEVQYQGPGGVQYQSKLDAFEEFTARAKMAALPLGVVPVIDSISNQQQQQQQQQQPAVSEDGPQSSAAGGGGEGAGGTPGGGTQQRYSSPPRPTLIIIDDLPYTSGSDQRKRLARALRDLARCARFPVVLVATEASGRAQQERGHMAAAVSGASGLHKDIIEALSSAGATTISFNAITALNASKALHRVLEKEGRAMRDEDVALIAQQAEGDLRNALCTLQFACTGIAQQAPPLGPPPPKRRKGKASLNSKGDASKTSKNADVQQVAYMMRDTSLSVFHGLGKLLYNKRLAPLNEEEASMLVEADSSGILVHQSAAWACRAPMDGFCPERVIEASGLEPGAVAAFLHENLHNFIDNSAIDDIAACMSQISAADALEGGSRRLKGHSDATTMGDAGGSISASAAASVAARGVCFYNIHPAPRRWLPLQAPALYAVQRGIAANVDQLERAAGAGRVKHGKSGGLDGKVAVAAEIMPYLRLIAPPTAHGAPPSDLIMQQPAVWSRFWKGNMYETRAHAEVMPGGGEGEEEEGASGDRAVGGGGGGGRGAEMIEDPGDDW